MTKEVHLLQDKKGDWCKTLCGLSGTNVITYSDLINGVTCENCKKIFWGLDSEE